MSQVEAKRYRWIIQSKVAGLERMLEEPPAESIRTMYGAVLPPYVLTMWDDASLAAVGIARLEIEDGEDEAKA